MSNNNRELSQFASRITVDDTTNNVSIASSLNLTGKIGINQASPNSILEATNPGECQIRLGYSQTKYSRIGRNSSGNYEFLSQENGSALVFGTAASADGGGAEKMRITRYGRVGIGSDDPQTQLDVRRDSGGTIGRFYDTGSDGYALHNGGPIVGLSRISNGNVALDGLLFQVGIDKSLSDSYNIDETVFCVSNTGVGIGTDNPDSTLNIQSQNPSGSTALKFTAPENQPNKLQFHLDDGTLDAEIKNELASLIFFTDGNTTPCERMRIQSDKIDVNASILEVKAGEPRLCLNGITTNSYKGIEFEDDGTRIGHLFHNPSSGEMSLSVGENTAGASHYLAFKAGNGTQKLTITSSGMVAYDDIKPNADGTLDLGASDKRWDNVYINDIDLSNESKKDTGGNEVDGTWGSYNIQEGENDLFLINRRSGKKYKFNITDVS